MCTWSVISGSLSTPFSGREHQREGAAEDVGERVDLGRPAASRTADRLRFSPLLPPECGTLVFDVCAVDRNTPGHRARVHERVE